jgi:hypothetical protein
MYFNWQAFTLTVPVLSFIQILTVEVAMKRIMLSMTMLCCILAGSLSLPVSGEEQQTDRSKSARKKEAYEKSMKERLARLGARLDEVKKKADAGVDRAETKMKEDLAMAEKKRQVAVRKLEELERSSKHSWEKFSVEAEKAAKDFEQAFERAINARK